MLAEPERGFPGGGFETGRASDFEADLWNRPHGAQSVQFLLRPPGGGELGGVVLFHQLELGGLERAQVEQPGQVDQAAAADQRGDVVVAQRGNAHRHR